MAFANELAITTLIKADSEASDDLKERALRAVQDIPEPVKEPKKPKGDGDVVSLKRAAEILGYKSTRCVRKSLHAGVLRGFYGGGMQQRVTGIVTDSIYQLLGKERKQETDPQPSTTQP